MLPTDRQLDQWLEEVRRLTADQPSSSWTVARMRLVYPSTNPANTSVSVDTVSAAGNCNAHVVSSAINRATRRIEIVTTFNQFELRGRSHLIGPFRIVLQAGSAARGTFRQRFPTGLFPLQGEWDVPMEIETSIGNLIPRPTDGRVLLRSAEPGEFAIPPIGSWFEKWDPISLVSVADPDGPTLAIIEQAMHAMLNVGEQPAIPDFARV